MNGRDRPPKILQVVRRLIATKNFSEQDFIYDYFSKLSYNKQEELVLIDAGAHYGISMLRFAKSGWKVYCFEPDDNNRGILEKNIRDNELKNVIVDGRALSDTETKAKYYASEVSSGISSLIKFHPSHKELKEVDTVTLSSYCTGNDIDHIDFLKIDTEGYDLKVIKGLDLKKIRPKVILCEYEDSKTRLIGYSKEDMIKHLEASDYRCIISEWHPVVEYGTRHKWKKITDDITLVDDNSWGNIIAVEPELYRLFINAIKEKFRYKIRCLKLTGQHTKSLT
jgi:FkbM family methyltransferase